jgi:hypothetical protein
MITRPIAISSVSSTSLTACRIEMERSIITLMETDGGICARSAGSFASTPSTTATCWHPVLLNGKHDGAIVVQPGRDLVVLDAVIDLGDLIELHRRAVVPGHHLAIVDRLVHLAGVLQRNVLLQPVQRADRRRGIGARHGVPDVFQRQPPRRRGSVAEPSETNNTGKSAGLTFRKLGGIVISIGSRRCAIVKAVCTSSAAASMLWLRSNWMVISVAPCDELDDVDEMPAIVDS